MLGNVQVLRSLSSSNLKIGILKSERHADCLRTPLKSNPAFGKNIRTLLVTEI